MMAFGKSEANLTQGAYVASALSTVAQVMNQMAVQGYIPSVTIDFLGPILFTSSTRTLENSKEEALLLSTLQIQSQECKGIAAAMIGWQDAPPTYKVPINDVRAKGLIHIQESLSEILNDVTFYLHQSGSSAEAVMDASYSAAFEMFAEYFTIVADDNSGFMEIHSQITNLLSSSFVLFISDILKISKVREVSSSRVQAMVTLLATTSALFATVWDNL
jgi:hypothetical protein